MELIFPPIENGIEIPSFAYLGGNTNCISLVNQYYFRSRFRGCGIPIPLKILRKSLQSELCRDAISCVYSVGILTVIFRINYLIGIIMQYGNLCLVVLVFTRGHERVLQMFSL